MHSVFYDNIFTNILLLDSCVTSPILEVEKIRNKSQVTQVVWGEAGIWTEFLLLPEPEHAVGILHCRASTGIALTVHLTLDELPNIVGICDSPSHLTGEGNGNPLQCSCLENPRDGGAWWAAVYGVAQSRTRLKRLNSSSSSSSIHLTR